MRYLRSIVVAAACLVASGASAQTETAACTPTPTAIEAKFDFFMGMTPADTPLDVWCRLQALQGEFKFNVMFGDDLANKTFDLTLDGRPDRSKAEFAALLQSLLPMEAVSPSVDPHQQFGKVLERSVQLRAAETPDGQRLALHASHPSASAIALWEQLSMRIRPVRYAGADFVLTVNFRPSVGGLFASIGGASERLVLNGWWEDVLRANGASRLRCSGQVPDCKSVPDIVPLETGWVLDSIVMAATEGSLSIPAHEILTSLAGSVDRNLVRQNSLRSWSYTKGEGEVRVQDNDREVHARAEPHEGDIGGTSRIAVRWREVDRSRTTYRRQLQDYAQAFREKVYLHYEGGPQPDERAGLR